MSVFGRIRQGVTSLALWRWTTQLADLLAERANLVAAVVSSLFVVAYIAVGLLRIEAYIAGWEDPALYQNALWLAGQFLPPRSCVSPEAYCIPAMRGGHWPLGFVYGLLFYRWGDGAVVSVVLQALHYGVAGFLLYLLAVEILRDRLLGILVLIIYLVRYTPGVFAIYHEQWAAPYVAAGLLFTARRRHGLATLAWIGYMGWKGHLALGIAAFGIIYWFRRRQRIGLAWATLGLAWFVVAFFLLIPMLQPRWANIGLLGEIPGSSIYEKTISLFTSPLLWWMIVTRPGLWEGLALTLMPLAFLPVLGFDQTIGLVPLLLVTLLPTRGRELVEMSRTLLGFQGRYIVGSLPFLVAGGIFGYKTFRRWLRRLPAWGSWAAVVVVLVMVLGSLTYGLRIRLYEVKTAIIGYHVLQQHSTDLKAIIKQIPPGASVAAETYHVVHLTDRPVLRAVWQMQNAGVQTDFVIQDEPFNRFGKPWRIVEPAVLKGWSSLLDSPELYYSSADWQAKPALPLLPGYCQLDRRGSVVLSARVGTEASTRCQDYLGTEPSDD